MYMPSVPKVKELGGHDLISVGEMRVICLGLFPDYMIQLANALSKRTAVKLMLTASTLPAGNQDTIDEKVSLYLVGKGKKRLYYHPTNLFLLKDAIKEIKSFKPNIIHIQWGQHPWFFLSLPFIRKYPLVSTFHNPKLMVGLGEKGWDQPLKKFNRWCAAKSSDQIIVHGVKLKETMMKEYNLPDEKVHVIPIGEHEVAPFKKYEREDIKEDGNFILFFGSIWKYKGLEYLIKAEPLITKEVPDAKIIIAGTGEDFKKYEKMMINRDNFVVHNYRIPYKEGAELLQRCSVVVLPYIDASQSGVIPTAYGFKKPVVVTNVGSIPEIVDDGITGFIVPPKNPEALADAIVKLLKDNNLRKQMGENAYKKLKTDLSWDKIAEKTIRVYKKAIVAKNKK